MIDFESLKDAVYKEVKTILTDVPQCHDFSHTLRVLKNAERILLKEHSEFPHVVILGALLHDIARPEELESEGRLDHAILGEEKSKQILKKLGCGDQLLINRIGDVVKEHRFRGNFIPSSMESKIVYDADKLDSLGAFGIARAFYFAGRIGACLHNSKEEALSHAEYSYHDSAYREYLVKLRILPDKMLTQTGKLLAVERANFMDVFFRQMQKEDNGEI